MKSKSPILNNIKAIIFDMDDLMINSHGVHIALFEKIMNKYGASFKDPDNPLTKEEESGLFGMRIIDGFKVFIEKYNLKNKTTVEEMNNLFNELILPTYKDSVEPMPGIIEIINEFKKRNYILALASSSKLAKINIVLEKLNLKNIFQAVVSGEDENLPGKPNPDTFLKAAEKIGIQPEECLVLEDAKNGVEAGKAAKMKVVGVHNPFTFKRLGIKQDLHIADLEVNGLLELKDLLFTQII
ncbi:MAG: HAD family phosphatase [Patescibacteria group bacterium]|nr:HAD family phosphatase [Patescibacteria group bacterium]